MLVTQTNTAEYESQLSKKVAYLETLFAGFQTPQLEVFRSPAKNYRMRAEFRLWHEDERLYYAMFEPKVRNQPREITNFDIANQRIVQAMPLLLAELQQNRSLQQKVFQVNFLSNLSEKLLLTLIYHRRLEEAWKEEATKLAQHLKCSVIGRFRGQKILTRSDYIEEQLNIEGRQLHYRQYEQGFSQPNAAINLQMLHWACRAVKDIGADLLELYCGNANFTLPLSFHFQRVLATEVSRTSMHAAHHNVEANSIKNIDLARLSAEEVVQALKGVRPFHRLAHLPPLSSYNFTTVFVDPPRAGLDRVSESLVTNFKHIIYISCNPKTLVNNLRKICCSHTIKKMAFFDQFPYTPHIECGLHLEKKS